MKKMLFVLMVGGILSCAGNQGNQYQDKFNFTRFDSERAAWEALGINAYRFTGKSFASYTPTVPVTVTVLPGTEPELTYDTEEDGGDFLDYISRRRPFPPFFGITIDELFDDIRERALGFSDGIVTIRYNQKYHYPESFYVDNGGGNGGQSSLDITHFEVLEDESGE